jgi:probable F420-dependent oxidoreductase
MTFGTARLGAVLPQAEIRPADAQAVRDFAGHVDGLGLDYLVAFDHVLGADSESRPGWSGYYDHEVPFLEPLTLFAYLGATTSLELVPGVLVLPQRQTALVAKQAATVDVLLGGRLRLGVGIGWNEVEYQGLGVPFGTRAARMEEQITLLRRLWTEPVVSHQGSFDTIDRAGIKPLPVRRPIPVWIGCGDAPAALDRVGRLADGWIPHPELGGGGRVAAAWAAVRAAAERAGRDPGSVGLQGQVRLGTSGLPELTARVERWIELGATHVSLNTLDAGLSWPGGHMGRYTEVVEGWRAQGRLPGR